MEPSLKAPAFDAHLATAIRVHAYAFCEVIARALEQMPKWQSEASAYAGTRTDYLELEFKALADYCCAYFDRGDSTFRQLFVGELIKALYVAGTTPAQSAENARRVMESLQTGLTRLMASFVSMQASQRFAAFLDGVTATLTATPDYTQRVLFIGDCLFLDIIPFIVSDLLHAGIRLVPDYATSKNGGALRDSLRSFSEEKFDLVFYSPFSYEFSPEYTQLLNWKQAFMGERVVRDVVDRVWQDCRATLDLLSDLYDCPLHVHNSAAVIREENATKRIIKSRTTNRNRTLGRQIIDANLRSYIELKNRDNFQHLFLLDEMNLVESYGENDAGAYLYKTTMQHPAVFGKLMSETYVDLVYCNALLVKKKVIVSDLDNTLWEGVIGEGAVTHYHDRQRALKTLREKGVVLAINSKNDPANIHWRDGTLSDDDFVCAAVSWEPKVHGMRRIQDSLNLKTKDYVFVDDRSDELELMRASYPETLCLDATDERSWTRIGLWGRLLEDDQDMDRTQMYKQREARKAFAAAEVSSMEERVALYSSLKLRLAIHSARPSDLKRVAELINRTNQFNLEGSRTTLREVRAWYESPEHVILLGASADQFGDMGTTCIAVAQSVGVEMHILPFVLSCRVFGYGIEHGVMNHLKQIARNRSLHRMIGRFQPTSQNAPCKGFLAESGFVEAGGQWVFDLSSAGGVATPGWLEVTVSE